VGREQVSTGTVWEDKVGYSRAIRVGNEIQVSGTTATDDDGNIVGVDDPYRQTEQCIENIEWALQQLDAGLEHVIRTRLFVVDIDQFDKIGQAHGDAFDEIRPTTTIVETSGLVDPDMLLEMEAEAKLLD
jgi:enamine deaminase RidA (YjgF/YER057c/UK114 family)